MPGAPALRSRKKGHHRRGPANESFDSGDDEPAPPGDADAPSSELDTDAMDPAAAAAAAAGGPAGDGTGRRARGRRGRLLQLYAPKLPVVSSAVVFAVFAVLAPVADRAYHALATEGTLASDVDTVAHDLGRFRIEWDIDALALTVSHRPASCAADDADSDSDTSSASDSSTPTPTTPTTPTTPRTNRSSSSSACAFVPVWSTIPGRPFLYAANGPIRVHQLMSGHFKVDMKRRLQTSVQTVDAIAFDDPSSSSSGGERKGGDVNLGSVTVSGVLIKEDARMDALMASFGDVRAAWNERTPQRLLFKAESKLRASYRLTFTVASDRRLAFECAWDESVPGVMRSPGGRRREVGLNQMTLKYATNARDERFYGLGEQFSSNEHNGKRVPIITAEQGIGRGRQPLTFTFNRLFMGSGGSWHTTYTAIPHYVTSEARSVFLTDFAYGEFDFTDPDAVSILCVSPGGEKRRRSREDASRGDSDADSSDSSDSPRHALTGQIIGASSVPEATEAYTEYSGRQAPLPAWAQGGVILGMTGGSAKVRRVLDDMRRHDVPVAGLWLQDWGGIRNTSIGIERVWWNWVLDETHYPDWHELREEVLATHGARMLTYVNPFLMKTRGAKGELYRVAEARGYMVKTVAGRAPYRLGTEPGVSYGLIDLTNPDARRWIEDVIVDMAVTTGASGWMADFGEYLPFDCALHSGEMPVAAHNRYPEDWARLNRRAMARAGLMPKLPRSFAGEEEEEEEWDDDDAPRNDDSLPRRDLPASGDESDRREDSDSSDEKPKPSFSGVFWSRSASARSPRYSPLTWLGDQLVTWDQHDGMKSALMGMLQGGLSGLALSHSDIGGYTATPGTSRTKELLMRWMELSALSDAIFRTHQGNRPAHNAQPWDDDETLAHLAAFAKLHVILAPYKLELMRESERRGLPMARPLAMHYARDPVARRRTQQFLLGRHLLVAPVMDRGTNRVHAYLPPGDVWVDVWTTQQTPRTPGGRGEANFEGVERDFGDAGDQDPGGDRRGTWVTVDAPLGWPAVFIRRGASGEARNAAAAMREWAAARGGVPSGRKVALMDPVEKLVLGLY